MDADDNIWVAEGQVRLSGKTVVTLQSSQTLWHMGFLGRWQGPHLGQDYCIHLRVTQMLNTIRS